LHEAHIGTRPRTVNPVFLRAFPSQEQWKLEASKAHNEALTVWGGCYRLEPKWIKTRR